MIAIKNYKFNYKISADYSDFVSCHSFSVMLLPQSNARQKITNLSIDIKDCARHYLTTDSFGNKKCYGRIDEPHKSFELSVSGIASTGLDIYEELCENPLDCAMYKLQTPITAFGEELTKYRSSLELEQLSGAYEKALHIMHTLHYTFSYSKGSTCVHTTAEEALSRGKGVCQDYAHIMISLLRSEGIAARYVVGLIPGEGASHAWAEALCNGYWYGFDPTNNKLVNDEYIKASCGRDSNDCSVIRGSFRGNAKQTQLEAASVFEI